MGQSSTIIEKEDVEMMNVVEAARAIEWLRAKGLSEKDANDFLTYIATGVGLPIKEPTEEVTN